MDFDWMEIGKKIAIFVGAIVGAVAMIFLASIIVFLTYKSIAWHFNLPMLNYWTICGAIFTIRFLFGNLIKIKKEEE